MYYSVTNNYKMVEKKSWTTFNILCLLFLIISGLCIVFLVSTGTNVKILNRIEPFLDYLFNVSTRDRGFTRNMSYDIRGDPFIIPYTYNGPFNQSTLRPFIVSGGYLANPYYPPYENLDA